MLELGGSGAEPLEEEDPRQIGPIPLIGRLGAGGMGRVYLGVHEGRYAAVKQLLPSVVAEDKDFLRRFGHELDNLARLPEQATAPLLAGDRAARPPWFATAYVPGLTLTEAIEVHDGPLPVDALWLLLREAASGLAVVHALDMVHRDLKPSNVMLTLDGLTLIDFGVARAAEQSQLTRTGMVVGTPAYMSPEQASGGRSSTGAVDVFALGSVLAYAASGRPPFGDESGHAVLYRIVHEEPDLDAVRELDPDLADVVTACLDKDFEARPTAAELVQLADRHGPFTPPLWPESVTGRLSERAAFAETVQPVPATPDTPAGPDAEKPPATDPATPPVVVTAPPERRERRRRTRVLFAVVPVVAAVGGTLAVQLLPYVTDSGPGKGAEAGAGPTSSVSASLDPTAPPSESAEGSPKPSTSASSTSSPSSGGKGAGGAAGGDGADRSGAAAGGPGAGGDSGAGGGKGANGANGSSGSSGSSGSDGSGSGDSNGSAGAGSGSGSGDAGAPASGDFGLKNGEDGKCLIQVFNSTDTGSCTGTAAHWTFRSGADGAVKVVNESGSCLSANMKGQAVFTADCASGGTALLWRSGSGGTLVSVFNGGCLDLAFGSGVATQTCASGTASQRWTREA